MKKVVIGGLAVLALTAPVFAADMAVKAPVLKAPPPPPVYVWSGFYIGGYVGGSWGEHTVTSVVPGVGFFDNNPFQSYRIHGSGFLGGGTIGYNFQFSNIVLGVEAEGGYLGARKTSVVPDGGDAGDQLNFKYSGYAVLAARFGLAFDRLLVYAKGGGAWARVKHVEGDLDLPGPALDPNFSYSVSKTAHGWAAGGGLEWAWTNNWTIKGEYLFLQFDDFTARDAGARGYKIENEVHTAKIGLNYKFGPAAVRAAY
jgi:outer membrane immunogenic protein